MEYELTEYKDKFGFEIREGLDEEQNRVLLKIYGSGSFFSIPDGIYALAKDAFSEVEESMRYVFIPKSVKIIPAYTFGHFRGSRKRTINGKEVHELDILCEADSRPEGFYEEAIEDDFEEDYAFYTEYRYFTWCGEIYCTLGWERDSSLLNKPPYGYWMPHVHWGISAQESLKYYDK